MLRCYDTWVWLWNDKLTTVLLPTSLLHTQNPTSLHANVLLPLMLVERYQKDKHPFAQGCFRTTGALNERMEWMLLKWDDKDVVLQFEVKWNVRIKCGDGGMRWDMIMGSLLRGHVGQAGQNLIGERDIILYHDGTACRGSLGRVVRSQTSLNHEDWKRQSGLISYGTKGTTNSIPLWSCISFASNRTTGKILSEHLKCRMKLHFGCSNKET